MYLSQYGWLDKSSMKPGSAALLDIRGAIRDFQSFAGLNQTGDLDEETVKLMGTPRCGVRDKIGHDARRKKRYVLQGKATSIS
jgi:matrix metalloproteinase-14 (membrane-inserted)